MPDWIENTQTLADVKLLILDNLHASLPRRPMFERDCGSLTGRVYDFVRQPSAAGVALAVAT